jgi:uncharacterized protein involved in exopolysaccharide biosynthesis
VLQNGLVSDLTKRDLAHLVFKKKSQILGIFGTTLVLVTIGTYLAPRSYVASSTVYLVRNLPPIASVSPTTLNIMLDRKEVLNSEVDLITSRSVGEKVADILLSSGALDSQPKADPPAPIRYVRDAQDSVGRFFQKIGLTDRPPDRRQGLVGTLLEAIEAKPGVNSNFITVTGKSENPQFAALLVNTFTKVYVDQRLALFKRPGLEDFYEQQIQRARAALEEVDRQMSVLKTETGVVTADEQLRLKLQELSVLNDELNKVRSEKRELLERTEALRTRIDSQPDAIMSSRTTQRNPAIGDLEKKGIDLATQRAIELNRFQQDSPAIQELDRSIDRLKEEAARQAPTVVNTESMAQNTIRTALLTDLYRAESDHDAKDAREATLLEQIAAMSRDVHSVDANASTLKRLAEAATTASKTYATYIAQREDARIAAQTDAGITNVKIISQATVPTQPRFPRMMLIMLGAFIGLFMGCAVALISELFSHTLNRRDDIERELGLPLLASMPDSAALQHPI